MSQHGNIKVPAEGPTDARIMIVGEAPGVDEETARRPFIGRSGQLLTSYLGRLRVRRDEVWLTNLCKYRPRKNEFKALLGMDALDEGLAELQAEIETVKPNIIIACGAWPMYYLTGATGKKGEKGTGISLWRGSVVPSTLVPGQKVLITYHPAFIVRPQGFSNHPIFYFDLSKAIRESESPDLHYPHLESLIDPPDIEAVIREIERTPHEMVACDIETFGEQVACVGFASEPSWGLCLTYEGDLDAARYLWESQPLCFQFGTFDANYMRHYYGWNARNVVWDTYVASASLMPEFPRGLDFLASVYTDYPFYKEERKTWKQTGDMTSLWEYNVKDVAATLTIALEQRREIEEIWGRSPSLLSSSPSSSFTS